MAGEDKKWVHKQEQKAMKKAAEVKRRQKAQEEEEIMASTSALLSSSDTEHTVEESTEESESETGLVVCKPKRQKCEQSNSSNTSTVLTKNVTSALNRSKVTDRQAVHLLAATAHSLGHSVDEMTISRSSIRRMRITHRQQCATDIKHQFITDSPLIVHWDGKLLPDITGRGKVDRLPVIVTGKGVEQLLGVRKLPSGTGQAQASAVVSCLDEWKLKDKVKGLCFDTMASNTGRKNGACILIEQALGRDLLNFACRHHVLEIMLEKVFTTLKIIYASSGPDIALFKRFTKKWAWINHSMLETTAGMKQVETFRNSSVQFAVRNLEICQPCDDYREFLELVIVFLGGIPPRGVHIIASGALHSARWMARILYCYKMWRFRSQFKLKASEEKGIFNFLLFVSDVYMIAWFEAPLPVSAPANDLMLLRQLSLYENPVVREEAVVAFSRHLWYLSERMVGLALLDPNVDEQEKILMVSNMCDKEGSEDPSHRLDATFKYAYQPLSYFVTKNTLSLFDSLDLPKTFLHTPVRMWQDDQYFKAAEQVVKALTVVNDSAARGVKLIQDFNDILTKNEEQKPFLLQVIQEHRQMYPDFNKATVVAGLHQ